jgi:hypothetical protein
MSDIGKRAIAGLKRGILLRFHFLKDIENGMDRVPKVRLEVRLKL